MRGGPAAMLAAVLHVQEGVVCAPLKTIPETGYLGPTPVILIIRARLQGCVLKEVQIEKDIAHFPGRIRPADKNNKAYKWNSRFERHF